MNVAALFEKELTKRDVVWKKLAEHRYAVRRGAASLDVTLDNLALEVARDGAKLVPAFVEKLLTIAAPDPKFLFWAAEAANQELGDAICEDVTETVKRVLVATDANESVFTWVTRAQVKTWKLTLAKVRATADRNQSKLLDGIALEISEIDGKQLAMVPLASALKASVIFAKKFKALCKPLGWPVMAVIPCRDFIYIVADRELLGRMGAVVQREFRGSGYPITTEVLQISDDGIEAIGKFPE